MNARFTGTANWRPLLVATVAAAMLLTARTRGAAAQPPDELSATTGPCADGRKECDWSTSEQHAAKRQNVLDELLLKLAERDRDGHGQNARDSSHVRPRFAVYAYGHDRGGEPPANRLVQQPFASGWKSRYGGNGGNGQMRLWRPFNGDNKRARYAFSSWGGKRSSPDPFEESAANALNVKREPAFSSWGGKRAPTFFNWGGKRSIADDELDRMTTADDANDEHAVMKRDVRDGGGSRRRDQALPSALATTADVADGVDRSYDQSRTRRLCVGGGGVAAARSGIAGNAVNLQQLLDEYVRWSRKQPEQKKAPFYRKMFNVRTLHSADKLSRRAGAFYPWGGKRSSRQKDD